MKKFFQKILSKIKDFYLTDSCEMAEISESRDIFSPLNTEMSRDIGHERLAEKCLYWKKAGKNGNRRSVDQH